MPTVALEVPETYDSITRPIVTGMVKDLIDQFGLPNDTSIRYLGNVGEAAQRGSQLTDHRSGSSFPFTERVDVNLEEQYLEEGVLNTSVKRHDNNPVFLDPQLLVSMKPVYVKTEATITFRYRTQSKTQAHQWRDALRRRMTQGTQANLHELIYHYPIPGIIHKILEEIHSKRETVAGYGDSFTDWLRNHYDSRMTVLSNLDGSRGIVAIPEKQIQVQGWFSFESEPDQPDKDNEGDAWIVEFNYTFQYDKVTSVVLDYPIVVHNQLLDDKYIDFEKAYNPYNVPRRPSHTGRLNDAFSRINYNPDSAFKGVNLPTFDDWTPRGKSKRDTPIFTSLIGVELDNPTQIVNLMELGDISLTQSVINFIFRERQYLTTYLASVFHITFYKGRMPVSAEDIYIDEHLNVVARAPLDPRDVHHVRLSVIHDLKNLSARAKEALRRDPEVCFQVVDVIDGLQKPWLPMAQSVGAQTAAENIQDNNWWNGQTISRPGFQLPSANYDRIKPKSGNPYRNNNVSKEEEQAEAEGRLWHPVSTILSKLNKVTSEERFSDWLEQGGIIVLTSGTKEGKENVVVFINGDLWLVTINHFLGGRVVNQTTLTEDEFLNLWVDNDHYLINEDANFIEYLNTQFSTRHVVDVLSEDAVLRFLTPNGDYVIINQYGIYQPTFNNSRANRIKSPTRPRVNAPMLSDQLQILGGKVITKPSFDFVVANLKSDISLTAVSQGQGMRTVMQAGIITH